MATTDVGRSYWMPAAVPLTSTNNEVQFGVTSDAKADILVVGGLTNLAVSGVKVRDVGGVVVLANESVPVLSLFGKRDSARPVFYYKPPFTLGFGNRLEAEVKNAASGAEDAGHLVYLGIPQESPAAQLESLEARGTPFVFSVDSKFTNTADEIQTTATPEQNWDVVIHGAYTDLNSAQLRIQGARGEQWMPDFTPIWALAGRSSAELNTLFWPRPYLIPKGSTLTLDFKNAGTEASGKLYLVGQKLS